MSILPSLRESRRYFRRRLPRNAPRPWKEAAEWNDLVARYPKLISLLTTALELRDQLRDRDTRWNVWYGMERFEGRGLRAAVRALFSAAPDAVDTSRDHVRDQWFAEKMILAGLFGRGLGQ